MKYADLHYTVQWVLANVCTNVTVTSVKIQDVSVNLEKSQRARGMLESTSAQTIEHISSPKSCCSFHNGHGGKSANPPNQGFSPQWARLPEYHRSCPLGQPMPCAHTGRSPQAYFCLFLKLRRMKSHFVSCFFPSTWCLCDSPVLWFISSLFLFYCWVLVHCTNKLHFISFLVEGDWFGSHFGLMFI